MAPQNTIDAVFRARVGFHIKHLKRLISLRTCVFFGLIFLVLLFFFYLSLTKLTRIIINHHQVLFKKPGCFKFNFHSRHFNAWFLVHIFNDERILTLKVASCLTPVNSVRGGPFDFWWGRGGCRIFRLQDFFFNRHVLAWHFLKWKFKTKILKLTWPSLATQNSPY